MSLFADPQQSYQRAKSSGDRSYQLGNDEKQKGLIEKILSDAQSANDPDMLHQSIGKILSQVAPERQAPAMAYIQSIANGMQEKKQLAAQNQSLRSVGVDPNLPPKLQELQFKALNPEDKGTEKQLDTNEALIAAGYPPEQAAVLSKTMSPATARTILNSKLKKDNYEPTSTKLQAERTQGYITKTMEKAESAQGDIRTLEQQQALIKSGATGAKLNNFLADYFNIPALKNDGTVAYNSTLKRLFSGFGDVVRGKVSDNEFKTLSQAFAGAELSPRAGEAVIEGNLLERKIAVKEGEIAERLRTQFSEAGQAEPANFDLLVKKELKPYADLLAQQTTTRILQILNPTSQPSKANAESIQADWDARMKK